MEFEEQWESHCDKTCSLEGYYQDNEWSKIQLLTVLGPWSLQDVKEEPMEVDPADNPLSSLHSFKQITSHLFMEWSQDSILISVTLGIPEIGTWKTFKIQYHLYQ